MDIYSTVMLNITMKNILAFFIIGLIGYGLYYAIDEYSLLKQIECLSIGKTPISTQELGITSHESKVICAEPTTDGGKECYDSIECKKACILDKSSEGYEHAGDFISQNGNDVRGHCQEYNESACFVERNRGVIVIHKCSSE